MRILSLVLISLCLYSCHNTANTQSKTNAFDTTYLKTIKWDSLNEFVRYHIIKLGKTTADTNFQYRVKLITVYRYFNHKFDTTRENHYIPINFRQNELTNLILCDTFFKYSYIDCLLKIDSKIFYKAYPNSFNKTFIRPSRNDGKSIEKLIKEIKKEDFVQEIKIDHKSSFFDSLNFPNKNFRKDSIITITLKPSYRSLENVKNICYRLKKKDGIEDAFFSDLFSGLNEYENFWRITTKQ